MYKNKIVRIVTAMDVNGLIGRGNTLPWPRITEDMKWFKEQTMGHTVVYGRKTWDSLPEKFRPLPGRQNIILSRQRDFKAPKALVAPNFEDAVIQSDREIICIIGGAEIYGMTLAFADELIISHISLPFEGDVYFPRYDKTHWRCTKDPSEMSLVPCATQTGNVVPICFAIYKWIAAP